MSFIVKNTTFPSILDLLMPHSCRGCGHMGEPLCECCKNNIIKHSAKLCPNCKRQISTLKCPFCNLPPIFMVGERNGLLELIINDLKYNSVRSLAPHLANLLNKSIPNFNNQKIIIVPIPTSTSHIRERALDHTLLIAKHLAKSRHYQIERLLLRSQNTTQVGANKKTRSAQAKNAFVLNPKIKINPEATYLLLDDVWTTGSTIKAALEKLSLVINQKQLAVAVLAVSRLN